MALTPDELRFSNNITLRFGLETIYVANLNGVKFRLSTVLRGPKLTKNNELECLFVQRGKTSAKNEGANSFCILESNTAGISWFNYTFSNLKPGSFFNLSLRTFAEINEGTSLNFDSEELTLQTKTSKKEKNKRIVYEEFFINFFC